MKLDNITQDVCTLELKASACDCVVTANAADCAHNQTCPHCGESYYRENYGITTAVYYPPIYKNGVNINPDKNKTTVNCTCMNCGKEFAFSR
jgi:hypothetical protein